MLFSSQERHLPVAAIQVSVRILTATGFNFDSKGFFHSLLKRAFLLFARAGVSIIHVRVWTSHRVWGCLWGKLHWNTQSDHCVSVWSHQVFLDHLAAAVVFRGSFIFISFSIPILALFPSSLALSLSLNVCFGHVPSWVWQHLPFSQPRCTIRTCQAC